MRTISRTAKFKKDYKREAKGEHRTTLDADLLAAISHLATDQTLPEKFHDHPLAGEYTNHRESTSNPICFLFTRYRTTTHCDWCASALTASYSDDDLHGGRGLWAPRSENPDLEHPNLWLVRRGPPAAGLPAHSLFFFPVVVHRRGSGGVELKFIVSHISKSRCGPPGFMVGQTWATRQTRGNAPSGGLPHKRFVIDFSD
jgi:mRNA interferase YafQ